MRRYLVTISNSSLCYAVTCVQQQYKCVIKAGDIHWTNLKMTIMLMVIYFGIVESHFLLISWLYLCFCTLPKFCLVLQPYFIDVVSTLFIILNHIQCKWKIYLRRSNMISSVTHHINSYTAYRHFMGIDPSEKFFGTYQIRKPIYRCTIATVDWHFAWNFARFYVTRCF